jgi:hypothetical protein
VGPWGWGVLALMAIVFGGVSLLAIPPLGLLGLASLGYMVWLYVEDHRAR